MKRSTKFQLGVALIGSQLVGAVSAQAASPARLHARMLVVLLAVASQNACFTYSYDKNGNRKTKGNLTYGAHGTWGSSTYGCSNWG